MLLVLYIVTIVTAVALVCIEYRRDLMMLQQNSYRRERYMHWLRQSGDTTSYRRLTGVIIIALCLSLWCPDKPGMVLICLFCISGCVALLRAKYKKPLVMTARATRIYVTALILAAAVTACAVSVWHHPQTMAFRTAALILTALYCASHIILITANSILHPIELSINKRYTKEATDMLAAMPDLTIIGITGSYGKTTTKHYLHRILCEQYETLMTPGSFNTPLGVVRTIREQLKPYHRIFIVEMGAKNIGDIKEICDLVRPSAGIITAVGPQHLESFKTIANVQATKFELADALPANGLIVVNNDFEPVAERKVSNTRCIRYAIKSITDAVDYCATDITYSAAGTSFTVKNLRDGSQLKLHTPLVGECNISNILAAVIMARHAGVSDMKIAYAVERLEQVEHRLSIKRTPGGLTIIDDAFNSNPVGSAMALDVLASMQGGKRILITPGMIELGERQEELNSAFGQHAATSADIVIIVGHYNRNAIAEGLRRGGMNKANIHPVDTFTEAQRLLAGMATAGDTILYENDLPDTFK